jgi:AcrR family transcriptional regulator
MTATDVGTGRSAERRAELLDAAARVIREHGSDVSMAAIAAAAGITKPILYRHFGDKGGLFRALAERQTDELMSGIREAILAPGTPRERTEAAIDAYLAAIEKRPAVYRFVVGRAVAEEPSVAGSVAGFMERLAAELADVIRADLQLPPTRARVWAHGIVGMVHAAGDWWLGGQHISRQRLVHELTDLLFGGLASAANVGDNQRRA